MRFPKYPDSSGRSLKPFPNESGYFFYTNRPSVHTKLGNPLTSFGYDGFANSCRRVKLCTRFQPDWIRLDGDKFIFFSGDRVGVIKRNCERYDLVKMKCTES